MNTARLAVLNKAGLDEGNQGAAVMKVEGTAAGRAGKSQRRSFKTC